MRVVTADLSIESSAWAALGDLAKIVDRYIAAAIVEADPELPEGAEVSCLFCDDAAMRALNARWRGLDKPTNVLSFPAAPGPGGMTDVMLGDIVLAYGTIEAEAATLGKPIAAHVAHLIVHGFLHLLGYDHETEEEAEEMEELESRALRRLGFDDPHSEHPAAGTS